MKMTFLNTYIDNLTMQEALLKINQLVKIKKNAYVVTPNVDHIVRIEKDSGFRKIYNNADLVLTDGMPLVWLSKMMKCSIKEKVSGSDIFPKICEMAAKEKYKLFFLGAGKGVAEKAKNNLTNKIEGLDIVGTYSPPIGFEKDHDEMVKILAMINKCSPDLLIVALGSPKQEEFMYENKDKMNVSVSLGLGASLDFIAGNVKRAPKWVSDIGCEWLYRFLQEPRRMFRRYFVYDMNIFMIIWKYRKQFIK